MTNFDVYSAGGARAEAENAKLRAALKPVLSVGWVFKKCNYCSGAVPTRDTIMAVLEAQRIYNEGEEKSK